jgi:hypothetical protein
VTKHPSSTPRSMSATSRTWPRFMTSSTAQRIRCGHRTNLLRIRRRLSPRGPDAAARRTDLARLHGASDPSLQTVTVLANDGRACCRPSHGSG